MSLRSGVRWVFVIGAWGAASCGLAFTIPTLVGATVNHVHAALQLVRPWLGLLAGLPLLIAALYRRPVLAVVSGFCVIANVIPVWNAVTSEGVAEANDDAVTIYVANARYNNATPEILADQALTSDADMMIIIELTPQFAELLQARGVDDLYPHQVLIPLPDPSGEGIYSRVPLVDEGHQWFGEMQSPFASIQFGTQELRVIAAHTYAPNQQWGLDRWTQSLESLDGYLNETDLGPTVVAGDFNAARWHPAFRRLLSGSFEDAHELVGKGLTPSWPTGGGLTGRLLGRFGPFVRIDHALVRDAGVVDVVDLPAAGSDHLPFMVTIAPDPA